MTEAKNGDGMKQRKLPLIVIDLGGVVFKVVEERLGLRLFEYAGTHERPFVGNGFRSHRKMECVHENILLEQASPDGQYCWTKGLIENVCDAIRLSTEHYLFEEGRMTGEQFYFSIRNLLPEGMSYLDFVPCWVDIYDGLMPNASLALEILSNKGKVVALTNTNALHEPVWRRIYGETMQYFSSIYCSHHIGYRKPDSRCFQYLLRTEGCDPDHVVFLDDREGNVDAAKNQGIKSTLISNKNSLYDVACSLRGQ